MLDKQIIVVITGAVLIMVASVLVWDMTKVDVESGECYYPYIVSGGIVGTVCWYEDGSVLFCGQTEAECLDMLGNKTVSTPTLCDPSYPDFCLPYDIVDLDCKDMIHRGFAVLPPDRHRFDADRDGIGCET